VSEHGHPPRGAAAVPATFLGRAGQGIDRFIAPIYKWLGYLAAAVIFALVVAMCYSAFGRYLNHPLNGSGDIMQYGLLVMVALALGVEHMGREKIVVDAVVRLFPKKVQQVVEPIIHLLVVAILIIAIWQLIKHGITLYERHELTKGTLHLPKAPFCFIMAFGMFTLLPIVTARLLWAVDRLVKR